MPRSRMEQPSGGPLECVQRPRGMKDNVRFRDPQVVLHVWKLTASTEVETGVSVLGVQVRSLHTLETKVRGLVKGEAEEEKEKDTYIRRGTPKTHNLTIKLILTYLNFGHLQSPPRWMHYIYQGAFCTAQNSC